MKSAFIQHVLLPFRCMVALCAIVLVPLVSNAVGPEYAVYDSISGINNGVNGAFTATGGVPRSYIGDIVNFYYPPAGPINITAMDLGFAYRGAATTLSALNVSIKLYESTSNTVGTDVLQNPVTNVLTFDIRQPIVNAYNAANGTSFTADTFVFQQANYLYQLELPTPVTFADRNLNGIAVNYSANAGNGFFSDNTLTSVLRVGPALEPTQGSRGIGGPRSGFLRDASGRSDFNFNQDDQRTLAVLVNGSTFDENAGLALRFYSDVMVLPESNTLVLFALGAGIPVAGLLYKRRKAIDNRFQVDKQTS